MLIFNLASKGPVSVKVDGVVYELPRFKRRDWEKWRDEIDQARVENATKDFDSNQRAQFLMLYPLEPITNQELRKHVNTIEGTGRIFRVCAEAGGVPADAIKRIVDEGDVDEGFLEAVALVLASIADPADIAKRLGVVEENKDDKGGNDDNFDDGEDPNDPLHQSPRD